MAHSHFPRHDFGEDRSPRRRARVITACVLAAVLAGAASYAVWLTATGSGEPATAKKGPTVANGSVVAAPVVTPKMKEVSFWKPATKVKVQRHSDNVPLELGTRFTVSRNGWVAGIRFYKASGETGRHTGSLWDSDGNQLAKVTFAEETATGWQEAHFDEPAMVAADHVYTVSYHSENGVYVGKPRATSLRSGPLMSEAAKTGVYRYGKGGGFPTKWNPKNYNYYVDVIYRWLDGGPEPTPTPAKPTPTPSKTPSKSPTPKPKPPVVARTGNCPAFPTPSCTGVPAGKKLRALASNMSGDTYRVTKAGTVLDGVHVSGTLLITAANVTVRNSLIDGDVKNEYDRKIYPFTISDSTIGPESGCDSTPGLWNAEFTATGVHIRNHVDGVSVSGDNVKVRDSFIILCSHSGDHSDGIQTVGRGDGLIFDHNTVDQSDAPDHTAPVFLVDPSTGVSVTNNLLIGGTYTIRLRASEGTVAKNNLVANKSWDYGPSDSDCGTTDWSGNKLVTVNSQYRVTSTVGSLACEG
ncbi:DUF4082 domain-containing protein [Planotetraspora mira]|uniref:DUF4082 domain-containing protein n=1 Tax=Planotetraspora mira TaxID=58121 RepID=A0A8J3X849_9ACTN|nr:DUF4082 domain-containing protein [Planotetraspora mira]GII30604.1 hypothetical protein Pmi06nite_40460 [Planotetraspora mira]